MRMFLKINKTLCLSAFGLGLLLCPLSAQAATPNLHDLQYVQNKSVSSGVVDEAADFSVKIRRDAMRQAARSYGARGGLAARTSEIMDTLNKSKSALDKTYSFRRLLITAPSNLLIEPLALSALSCSSIEGA